MTKKQIKTNDEELDILYISLKAVLALGEEEQDHLLGCNLTKKGTKRAKGLLKKIKLEIERTK